MRRVLLIVILSWLWVPCTSAQSGGEPQTTDVHSNSGAAPAMGQDVTPPDSSQFPPLSGLDEASLEPNVAARSFFVYGGQAAELVDSNASNSLGKQAALTGVTHLLGKAGLQRLWERYQVDLDYLGGAAIYAGRVRQNGQVQELNFDARANWRTGAISLRDSLRYLPDGTFGGAGVGGLGEGLGSAGLGGAGGNRFTFFGGNGFGGFGTVPRVTNLAIVDLQQAVSPRTSFTLAGGYNILHFTQSTGGLLIDSHAITAQAGYDYAISRHDKIALVYGYQHFQFPEIGGMSFASHVAQLLYGHQITGRMELLLGGGPQFTLLNSTTQGKTARVSASARASLRYKFPRATVGLSYDRYNSEANGLFAGALTDRAGLSGNRALSRRWSVSGDLAYIHYRRLQVAPVGLNAGSAQGGFVGARLHRSFNRQLSGFISYSFNYMAVGRPFCSSAGNCDRISNRHVAGVGLLWHPPAKRLD